MLNRQTTPEECAREAEVFVAWFKRASPTDAYRQFKRLQEYMEAVYWPQPSPSTVESKQP